MINKSSYLYSPHFLIFDTPNTELNDLRKIICLRKSEVSVESISVCNVIEKNDGAWHTLSAMLLYQCHHKYTTVTSY